MTPSVQLESNNLVYHKRDLSQDPSVSDCTDNESQSSHSPSITRSTSETSSHSRANSPATNLQQLPYLRFECGCEQCSVYDYISGKICPNPKQLPFPKLEVSQIPPEEIDFLEEELTQQTKSIYLEFCSLVMDTFKQLRESVDHTELISYLKVALKPNWYSPYVRSASKSLNKLEEIYPSDLPEYLIDKYYCSWFDYELIKHLRKRYLFPSLTDEDKALSDYKECLRCYISRRCFIYFHNTGPLPKNHTAVVCKIDSNYSKLTREVIKHFKYVFTKIIGASKYHLAFMKAKKGCTELSFGAPPYFREITKLSKYQVSQLKDHGFLEVTIDGRELLPNMTHGATGSENSIVGDGH